MQNIHFLCSVLFLVVMVILPLVFRPPKPAHSSSVEGFTSAGAGRKSLVSPVRFPECLYQRRAASSPPNALTGTSPLNPWVLVSTQMWRDQCDWHPPVAGIKTTSVSQPWTLTIFILRRMQPAGEFYSCILFISFPNKPQYHT